MKEIKENLIEAIKQYTTSYRKLTIDDIVKLSQAYNLIMNGTGYPFVGFGADSNKRIFESDDQ